MTIKKLAVAAVLGALALAPLSQSSQAAEHSTELSAAQVAALTPTEPMKDRAWIQGVVKDQFGNRLGNVDVHATSAADEGSSITYEEPGIAGSTGFYRVYDLLPGTYTLRFTSSDPKIRPASATVTVGEREIGRLSLAVKRILANTRTSAEPRDDTVSSTKRAKVDVSVSSKATRRPTGRVEVRNGNRTVGSGVLTAGDKGDLRVTLKRLVKGHYTLKAYFLGSQTLEKSRSRGVDLTVRKPRHRPNAS